MTAETTLMTEAATTTEGNQTATGGVSAEAQAAEQATQTQQAVEGKASEGGETATEGKAEEAGKEQKPNAPEKYEFKSPEGAEYSPEILSAFSEVSKELDLSQDAAQKILDKMAPAMQERQVQTLEKAKTLWADTTRADREIGGDKLQENLAIAGKALEAFGSPELRGLLNESGLGNHPEVIRMFLKAGKAISEDGFVGGKRVNSAAATDPAKRLFPNQV